jgi:hypothetical protein
MEALVAIVIDDHLPIGLSVVLLDDRFVAGFVLLDDSSVAIPIAVAVAVVRAYGDSGSSWTNSDTNIFRGRGCYGV